MLAIQEASAQISWENETKVDLTFNDLVQSLKLRFGSEGHSERYHIKLISRKREKNERLHTLHADILRLVAVAYPG